MGHYKRTEQGHNKLNVDVFMRRTMSFYFKAMLFFCVLQLEGIRSSCRELNVLKWPFSFLWLSFCKYFCWLGRCSLSLLRWLCQNVLIVNVLYPESMRREEKKRLSWKLSFGSSLCSRVVEYKHTDVRSGWKMTFQKAMCQAAIAICFRRN